MSRVLFTIALLVLSTAGAQGAPDPKKPDPKKPAVVRTFEAAQADADEAPPDPPVKQVPTRVKITFSTRPRSGARVYFGRSLLGTTPFTVERKHDSGPLDVVVRAPGYLPVFTRAYTFRDEEIAVELTRVEDASRLFGYKKKIEPPPSDEDAPQEGEEGEGETVTSPGKGPGQPVVPATPPGKAPGQPPPGKAPGQPATGKAPTTAPPGKVPAQPAAPRKAPAAAGKKPR